MDLETYRNAVNNRITKREDISNGKGGKGSTCDSYNSILLAMVQAMV